MGQFTTRPEITGTFGVVASTHWIASAVGFGILEQGGNAFDAAAAMGFVLNVVEPHLNGPGGEVPALIYTSADEKLRVLCGQGTAPAGATIDHYRAEGLEDIPGSGLLATVIPGAFDAWMLMLRDHGSLPLRDVLAPAIHYARAGHPVLDRVSASIAGLRAFFQEEWPSSAQTWLVNGAAPKGGSLFTNPVLAATWERIVAEAETARGREAQIDRARDAFYRGFVAETIARYVSNTEVMDGAGARRRGVLNGDDMAGWQASYEEPLIGEYGGWRVAKTGPWGQGPMLLQALEILKHSALDDMPVGGADYIHTTIEALKLSAADREAYYGDPAGFDIPMSTLLSEGYARDRAGLIGPDASHEQRPGRVAGLEHLADAAIKRAARLSSTPGGIGAGEPTMAHLANRRGDTVHIDVVDRWGNTVSATPSGGWLQSSPIIPGLGFALNSRAQMFWLTPGLPTSLVPGMRPRTTLSPSLAIHQDGTRLAFGTPGGDQQDQWQLLYFLHLVHTGSNLQAAIDAPLWHSMHFTPSFFPRVAEPGRMMIEPGVGEAVIAELRARGHDVVVAEPWTVGRLTAAARGADGILRGAATPRLMQAYAIGR